MRMPWCVISRKLVALLTVFAQRGKTLWQQTDMMPINRFHFINLGWINVKVRNEFCIRSKFIWHCRYPIIKASAKRNQKITIISGIICECGTVHAQHMQRTRLGSVVGTDTHQRGHHGNFKSICKRS